ncbi:MAG: hypothetical protein IJ515_04610 [Clostridia bacterium]|nr:hypothetical protein [Clostridia bacterium]
MRNKIKLIEPCYGTAYIRHINGLYLSMKDGNICLSKERFLWSVEVFENDRFYLGEISGHDKFEYWYGKFQTSVDSGYTEQHWRLYTKGDNVVIEHADSNAFIFFSNEENLVLKDGSVDNDGYYFCFEEPALTNGYPYVEVNSITNKIALRFEPSILRIVNREWLIDWANDLEKAMYSFSRLVGFMPFQRIEIRTYTNCNSWGYIFYDKPIVHVNNKDMEKEVIRMRKLKTRDISFGVSHEISHLFDKASWIFEAEATANLKLAYVLYELGYTASLNVHNEGQTFSYDNYADLLYEEHGSLDNVKCLFSSALVAKLVKIAQNIGWEPFCQTFRSFPYMQEDPALVRFEMLINKLSEYSNTDVRAMFTDAEWSAVYSFLSEKAK